MVKTMKRMLFKALVTWTVLVSLLTTPVLAEESVCAVVKIEILQELTLERQGFEAELKITNTLDAQAIENISVDVWFKDENEALVLASSDPNDVNAKFFIRVQSLDNISDVSGTGLINASEQAVIKWLIVPAPGTANGRERGTLYFAGADFNYTLDGVADSISVAPDTIYVKPMPLLTLDYFLPKEVIADDPLTGPIEATVPFTFGVRVKNNGIGDAKSLKIDSAQPKIVENEQGLLINFELLRSYVGDQQVANSLLLDFGDISPNQSKVGRWQMAVSLLGSFTEFTANFSHANEFGGQLTSLISATNTHFLIQDVIVDLPGRDAIHDFLAEGLPDPMVYESDGTTASVVDQSSLAALVYEQEVGEYSRYKLSMPATASLFYVQIEDTFNINKDLAYVTRSDGKSINSQNAWLSIKQNESGQWQDYINLFDGLGTDGYYFYFKQRVIPPEAPVIQFIPLKTTYEGNSVGFLVEASDPDANPVSLSAAPLPAGASFIDLANDSANFIWTPTLGQAGRYTITYVADDGSQTSSITSTIVVNPADDTDGDGLLDAWELSHFGNLEQDGSGDYDGDGISNQDEHDAGSNPAVPDGPPTPMIFSPALQGESSDLNVELIIEYNGYNGPHQVVYQFELYSDPTMTQMIDFYNAVPIDSSGFSRWSPTVLLQDNSHYYWRVRAYDGYTYSMWANGEFFANSENDLPSKPGLSAPLNGTSLEDSNALLEVSNSTDVDNDTLYYEFAVYLEPELQTPVAQSMILAEDVSGMTNWIVDQELNHGQSYYWQVKVTDEHNEFVLSDVFSFEWVITNQAPPAPQITSPLNNAELALTSAQLTAATVVDPNGDSLMYHYQVDLVNTFDSVGLQTFQVAVDPQLTDQSLALATLLDNQTYFWRVKAVDPQLAQSGWSTASFFVNTQNDAPSLPTIKNPGDGSWVDTLTPQLELYPSTDIDRDPIQYQFEVYLDANLTTLAQTQLVATPELMVSALADNDWYYWRARAVDNEGLASDWTSVARFFANDNNFDDPPSFIWLQPQQTQVLTPNSDVVMQWEDQDDDSSAVIALFYSANQDGSAPVIIAQNINEDDDAAADSFTWNIGEIATGTYYLFAQISDATSTVVIQAPGLIEAIPEPVIPGNVLVNAQPLIEMYEVYASPVVQTFSIMLDKQPEADVVVPLINPAASRLAIDKTSLTFKASDWNVPQVVTITPLNNCLVDGHINYEIGVDFAVSTDEAFHGIKGNDVNVLLYNDDPQVYEIDGQYSGQNFTICGFEQVDYSVQGSINHKYHFTVYGKNSTTSTFQKLIVKMNEKNLPIVRTKFSSDFAGIASQQIIGASNTVWIVVDSELPVINWINPDWYSLIITNQQVE